MLRSRKRNRAAKTSGAPAESGEHGRSARMEDDARDERDRRMEQRRRRHAAAGLRMQRRHVLRAATGELRAGEALVARDLRRRARLLRELLGRVTEAMQQTGVLAEDQCQREEEDGVEMLRGA